MFIFISTDASFESNNSKIPEARALIARILVEITRRIYRCIFLRGSLSVRLSIARSSYVQTHDHLRLPFKYSRTCAECSEYRCLRGDEKFKSHINCILIILSQTFKKFRNALRDTLKNNSYTL